PAVVVAGMECNVISLAGTKVVAIQTPGAEKIYDIQNQDGSTADDAKAITIAGASVTFLGMSNGNWTVKRKYGNWTATH
ncbi:unnamed protein product, partial [marine sediment metagenome]